MARDWRDEGKRSNRDDDRSHRGGGMGRDDYADPGFGSAPFEGGYGGSRGYLGGYGGRDTGRRGGYDTWGDQAYYEPYYSGRAGYGHEGDTAGREDFRGKGPRNYTRADDRIRDDIYDRLMGRHDADASDVRVEVDKGEVTIEGTVPHRHDKRIIEQIAEGVLGVKEVHNRLRRRRDETTSTTTGSVGKEMRADTDNGQRTPRTDRRV